MAADTRSAFFSYARADSEFALKLAKDLKASGAAVWLDQLDIHPGQRWDKAVEEALANCSRMLIILSPSSVDSTNVMDEVSYALEEQRVVIPVLHQECRIPFRLRRVQYIDFRADYAAGLSQILDVMGVVEKAEAAGVGQRPPEVAINDRREAEVAATQRSTPDGREAAPRKGTRVRGGPLYLRVILWTARILAMGVAAFIIILSFIVTSSGDKATMPFLILFSLAQLAAWKWEWQGGAAAVLAALVTAKVFPDIPAPLLLFLGTPTILFLSHWALIRRSQRVAGG